MKLGMPLNPVINKQRAYKLPKWFYIVFFIVPFPIIHFSHWWGYVLYFSAIAILVFLLAQIFRIPIESNYDKKEST